MANDREELLIRDRETMQPRPYYVHANNINLGDEDNYQGLPGKLQQMTQDFTPDTALDSESTKPIQNKVVKAAIDAINRAIDLLVGTNDVTAAIDSFNEVVSFLGNVTNNETLTAKLYELRQAIDAKQAALSFDARPTENSENMVKSGGIYAAIDDKANKDDVYDKTQIYNKTEVENAIDNKLTEVVVNSIPSESVVIIDDTTTGGRTNVLSAEQGKRLSTGSGSFAQAWARSKVDNSPFAWILNDTVDGATIRKTIWHAGSSVFVDAVGATISIEAAAAPGAPTIAINGSIPTPGGSYGKNAELVITPYADSALYWRIDSGNWNVSEKAVTVTLPSGDLTIEAYCANNAGNSSATSVSVTVAGTATPSFTAADGTTIDANNVVSRGGSVIVSVPSGGELHYCINGGSWQTASGLSVTIPVATNLSQGQMVIEAYNVEDNDPSTHLTNTYTMAALGTPTLAMSDTTEVDNQFPVGGGTLTITPPSGSGTVKVYYNMSTDGTTPADPTNASTEYTGAITINADTKIKVIAYDDIASSPSPVVSASYTVYIDHKFQFKIRLTGNNSTEYVPITGSGGTKYNFTVDWGDGDTTNYYNENNGVITDKTGVTKGCGHTYNKPDAVAGKEYTITLRGSKIPILRFGDEGSYNIDSLVSVEDNTLECETQFQADTDTRGGFYRCINLVSLSANALQNNTWPVVSFQGTSLASVPDGLLGHLTKDGVSLTVVKSLFGVFSSTGVAPTATITESQMRELSAKIGAVTSFYGLFYQFKGTVHIPDDFFSNLVGANVTSVQNAFWVATAGHAYGNKTAIYANLQPHLASGATETNWDTSITAPPSE